jgi:O-antigen biosynthesis protein
MAPELPDVTTDLATIEKKLSMRLEQKELELMIANKKIARLQGQLTSLYTTLSWRFTKPLRFFGQQASRGLYAGSMLIGLLKYGGRIKSAILSLLQVVKNEGIVGVKHRLFNVEEIFSKHLLIRTPDGSFVHRNDYLEWIRRYDTIDDEQRQNIKNKIAVMSFKPKISIILPVYDPPLHLLEEAIQSVRNQLYSEWELCIADDASKTDAVRVILGRHAAEDSRIKIVYRNENGHISAASNSALELATGGYVALMDNDDLLPEHALFWVAQAIIDNPDAGLIYSDEDKINEIGERYDPYFKCAFNYELFLAQNMICHLAVYRRDLIEAVGGFRVGFEGSQDYDLALRVTEQISVSRVIHIPRVLYHWRAIAGSTALSTNEKYYAVEAGRRAVSEHLQRKGVSAFVESAPEVPDMNRVRFVLPGLLPLVSIIIPTRDRSDLLELCVNSILQRTSYSAYEIIIIDNGSVELKTAQLFEKLPKDKVTIVYDNSPFNYSAINNFGAKVAKGKYLCLVNNDIEIMTPNWLEELLSFAVNSDVGCVGARLWYPNGRLQHGGVILGINGIAGHAYKNTLRCQSGIMNRAKLHQSLSAVTGACLLVRRHIFDEVGGFDESFVVALSDVDLCLRVREAGFRNVWTPYAEMIHHESASRGLDVTPEKQDRFYGELIRMQKRWGDILLNDPAYSPNLTLEFEDCSLAWPPRISRSPNGLFL